MSRTNFGGSNIADPETGKQVDVSDVGALHTTSFHEDGTPGQLISGVDYVAGKSGIDASTEALNVLTYEHHEIHAGSHYYICDYDELTNGQVVDFTVVTPDTAKELHMTFQAVGTGAISLEILEGVIVDTTGTVITPINNQRNSDNSSVGVFRLGDTFTAEGSSIYRNYAGANKAAGVISRDREFPLKRNTAYIFRFTNETTLANFLSYCAEWYEHTPKN